MTRLILRKTLTDLGYEVVECEDGRQAWEVMSSGKSPHLCILDWMMPEVTGPDLCKFARSLPDGHMFYLIILTTKSDKKDLAKGLGSGANDYIIKPFTKEELRSRLDVGCRYIELREQLQKPTG